MKATATMAFAGLPDGATVVKTFAPGDEIEGELAEVAVREGWADPADKPKADEPKANKSKGKAPENKGA